MSSFRRMFSRPVAISSLNEGRSATAMFIALEDATPRHSLSVSMSRSTRSKSTSPALIANCRFSKRRSRTLWLTCSASRISLCSRTRKSCSSCRSCRALFQSSTCKPTKTPTTNIRTSRMTVPQFRFLRLNAILRKIMSRPRPQIIANTIGFVESVDSQVH